MPLARSVNWMARIPPRKRLPSEVWMSKTDWEFRSELKMAVLGPCRAIPPSGNGSITSRLSVHWPLSR